MLDNGVISMYEKLWWGKNLKSIRHFQKGLFYGYTSPLETRFDFAYF